ncbi:hypothetical protein E1193_08380 [Micromonospora sp. KC606]|uniref:hypothetical protein n=1 Tax=Micromonospora sp. KC606 TaxID=2530379 RepID=UPI001042E1BE|nr:hypothetical protein [Micromonospora sp. KC606]TDC83573.1 hypothetical protein E1193_08380 [Micromonospora sp. KC606]
MDGWLLASGAVAGVTALIHVIAGGPDVVRALLGSTLPDEPMRTLHAVWHFVTADLLLSAVALLGLGLYPESNAPLVLFIVAHFLAYAAAFVVVTLRAEWSRPLLRLPQWMLLLPVAILAAAGTV